jgi:hypothetical protein
MKNKKIPVLEYIKKHPISELYICTAIIKEKREMFVCLFDGA